MKNNIIDLPLKKMIGLAVLLFISILLPLFLSPHLQNILILIWFFAYLGTCWNVLGGYCGQLSLAHAVFFGLGAYSSTFLFVHFGLSPWFGMLIGGIASVVVGLVIGYPCFRFGVKGPYFALITVAFGELMKQVFINWKTFGGASGILIPFKDPGFRNLIFKGKIEYYYIILFLLVVAIVVTALIQNSRLGVYFLCIKQNEEASEAIGIDILKYKLTALSISCFLTAMGGTFYSHYLSYIEPNMVMNIGLSIEIILAPIIGGVGTVWGPTIGAFILNLISESTKAILGGATGRLGGVHVLIYGLILIFIVLFAPQGITGYLRGMKSKRV